MTAADHPRERWADGAPGYTVLPQPVPLEETVAVHPVEPAEPPSGWGTGTADLGGGDDGD